VNSDNDIASRLILAKRLAMKAGKKANKYFKSIGDLVIESKGIQDMVSNADFEIERFIRKRLNKEFPNDGIVGEEFENVDSQSGYTWVIDPIDGTFNFVNGIPAWCVILACVHEDTTKIAAIFEPVHKELFWGSLGGGAFVNDSAMTVSTTTGLDQGNTGVGMSSRTSSEMVSSIVSMLVARGGLFYRNASGGLMLSYVAAGRLIGYVEPHMNAWDCLAGQLLIEEAGGRIEKQSAEQMLKEGGRIVASAPAVFEELQEMADKAFSG
jgi:myo-inositol-1(or 4)-monophosphatase